MTPPKNCFLMLDSPNMSGKQDREEVYIKPYEDLKEEALPWE